MLSLERPVDGNGRVETFHLRRSAASRRQSLTVRRLQCVVLPDAGQKHAAGGTGGFTDEQMAVFRPVCVSRVRVLVRLEYLELPSDAVFFNLGPQDPLGVEGFAF